MAGTLDFRPDPPELAADQTYSTTIRVEITRWWERGAPKQVSVSVRQSGQDVPPGHPLLVQRGRATYPLTGLQPKHHYLVVVTGEGRSVEKMIRVPDLPKPKRPEEEALELEQIQLKRAGVGSEHRKLVAKEKKLTRDEKKVVVTKTRLELAKAEKELDQVTCRKPGQEALELEQIELARTKVARQLKEEKKEDREPTLEERKIAEIKTQTELVKVEQELKETERKGALAEANKALDAEISQSRLKVEQARVAQDLKEATQGKPKLPKKLYLTFSGRPGRQKLFISVEADDGNLIPGFTGLVVDGDEEKTFTTNTTGAAFYQTDFKEEDRYFEVRVGNEHDHIWRGVLVGPQSIRRKKVRANRRP